MVLFFLVSEEHVFRHQTENHAKSAIVKHSLYLSGKQLSILRIEAPRTTVVRISNSSPASGPQILPICSCYGEVKKTWIRGKRIAMDVEFKIAEWPNMLNILNSLNGLLVDGHKWIVQPAPVFPPEVLRVLLSQPQGRGHVHATIHNVLQKLEDPLDTSEFSNFAQKYLKNGS